jgi:hypothetical protein
MGFVNHGRIGENIDVVVAGDGALGGGLTSSYVTLAGAADFSLLVQTRDVLSPGDTITCQFKQATDDAGSGAANLGSLLTYTVPGAGDSPEPDDADEAVVFDVDLSAYVDGNTHVAAVVTSSVAADGQLSFIKAGLRYKGENPNIA